MTSTFAIGGDLVVPRIGFGAMRLTGQPGNFGPYADWDGGKALLCRAVELGVCFFDTGLAYGPRHNEALIAEALHPYADGIVVATKGGIDKLSPTQLVRDASPATLTRQVDEALVRLGVEQIDLFQLHWVDPAVPIEESVAALDAARRAGKVRHIGLSNVAREELDRALAVAPIASIQNRLNSEERGSEALVDYTAAKGIAFIPYGPLGAHPMQRGARLDPAEALRWLLARSPNIIVIPGTTSIAHLEENVRALANA
ncbi:aldo/keto reductase [Methylobacterium iners]|uniref:Pyridoxine 4-dehydrogenase n=1 Tax=Methylobacterium iners TaxID=418707 RepID=A0ABQ4RS59_9HYPH|nr:aldo/keto reductase [Methylobacterium iners]GJD93616.1 Pyridoxine 4-dehydrogenase [Methylobacterium iners]